MPAARRALILSENAPVPSDRRVWNESRALTAAGWQVVIVSPQGERRCTEPYEVLEDIEIHRYPLRPSKGGAAGYLREYGQAMWRIRRLVRRLARTQRFDVVHACNPPDFLLLAALPLRRRGARFIFDHHDLVPELYRSKFGDGKSALLRAVGAFERLAFKVADVVIATNDSYRRVAIERGGKQPEDVFVVRNGPDLERFQPVECDPELRRGRKHLIAYLGIMGEQDGVDHAVRALAWLGERRDDWHAIFIGEGDVLEDMRALAADLGLEQKIEFAGWRGDRDIRRMLSTADVCLAPDPPSPLNDVSTMIKIPEYMAMGCPIVSYDLHESRVSGGEAALYADPGDPAALGRGVLDLLEDPSRRERMAAIGRARVASDLAWEHSSRVLLAAYAHAIGGGVLALPTANERAPAAPDAAASLRAA
jgi:glycosyltransferase involved in cell wall biosynthesis